MNMTSSTNLNRKNPITFVICAAGKGERFLKHGLTKPKPNLMLNGKTMLERSLDSLQVNSQDQLIIISNSSHKLNLKNISAEMLEVDFHTRGQLETFMLAKDMIKHNEIVIYNCDTYFESSELNNLIASGKCHGIIPCSLQPGDAWSFCLADQTNTILKVAEKKRISDWASVGYYYFQDKNLLFELAKEELESVHDREVYVAPLYERYLKRGYAVKLAVSETFLPFGTIEQVKDYWGISIEDFIAQNQ